ncbi:MAG: alpha/beta-type small acid-soluble spore protein [Firmicutes bacterium]|nr:alpha/beta-type small acid-soluble spore protein [Bacillota bacterium]
MAQFTDTNKLLPDSVLDNFKYEVAEGIGINDEIKNRGWGGMSSRDCGRVGGKMGGNMVKVLVRQAEEGMAKNQDFK